MPVRHRRALRWMLRPAAPRSRRSVGGAPDALAVHGVRRRRRSVPREHVASGDAPGRPRPQPVAAMDRARDRRRRRRRRGRHPRRRAVPGALAEGAHAAFSRSGAGSSGRAVAGGTSTARSRSPADATRAPRGRRAAPVSMRHGVGLDDLPFVTLERSWPWATSAPVSLRRSVEPVDPPLVTPEPPWSRPGLRR